MHTILPTKLDMNLFYAHFAKLSRVALQANPLRVNKVESSFSRDSQDHLPWHEVYFRHAEYL